MYSALPEAFILAHGSKTQNLSFDHSVRNWTHEILALFILSRGKDTKRLLRIVSVRYDERFISDVRCYVIYFYDRSIIYQSYR